MENNLQQLCEDYDLKRKELDLLREKINFLQKQNEINKLQEYVGKCYHHLEYKTWNTYLYINKLDLNLRLYCTTITFINDEYNNKVNINCESDYDFSCHYLPYQETLDECVEITKNEFLEKYDLFLEYFKNFVK